jgi:predicted aspartyl protease
MSKRILVTCLITAIVSVLTAQQGIAFLSVTESLLESEFIIEQQDVILPFDLDRGMIYVEAQVDENLGQYVLDTGAPSLVLNEKPINPESNPYVAQSCSAEVKIGIKHVNYFSWAGGNMRQLEAITLDLSHLENARNARVDGMIGYDILKKYTLLLDFDKEVLALVRPRSWKKWSERPPLAIIPFVLDGHLPIIKVDLNGQFVNLGIDTGAASNLMSAEVLSRLSENRGEPETLAEIQGLDQQVRQTLVRSIEQLSCSGFQFSDEFMMLDISHLNANSAIHLDGLLGYPFLSKYIVAIDYRRQLLLLWER